MRRALRSFSSWVLALTASAVIVAGLAVVHGQREYTQSLQERDRLVRVRSLATDITHLTLAARLGIEPSYDRLTHATLELGDLLGESDAGWLGAMPSPRRSALMELAKSRIEVVERFKRELAVVRNSQRYLTEALAGARLEARGGAGSAELASVHADVLENLVNFDVRRRDLILDRVRELRAHFDPSGRPLSASYLTHVAFVLEHGALVGELVDEICDPALALAIDSLRTAHEQRREAIVATLGRWQIGLVLVSTLLIATLVHASLALRRSAVEMTRINHGLEETVRRRSAELAQAQKLKSIGVLASGIAHEINTPSQYVGDNLAFLRSAVDDLGRILKSYDALRLAAEKGPIPSELLSEIRATEKELDLEYLVDGMPHACASAIEGMARISKIVRAMKEFSHPGSEDKKPTDIHRAIESTITVAQNEWKYVADLVTEFDEDLGMVPCLAAELNQVVLNIIVNAAQALAEMKAGQDENPKGRIVVRTVAEEGWALISISDDGPGIPAEVQSRVFDPFFTTKAVGAGTGQGLAIAHAVVVDKHGGTLEMESEAGHGTTFRIRLPNPGTRAAGPVPAVAGVSDGANAGHDR